MQVEVLPEVNPIPENPSLTEICEHPDLFTALLYASAEFNPIKANSEVKYGNTKFDYADVHACIAAVKPALLKHGLIPYFDTSIVGKTVTNTFVLVHPKSNQIKRFTPIPVEAKSLDPKETGAASTYGRRYAIVNALCLAVAEPEQEDLDNCHKDGFESVKKPLPKETLAPKSEAVKQLKIGEDKEKLLVEIRALYGKVPETKRNQISNDLHFSWTEVNNMGIAELKEIKEAFNAK